MNFVWFILRSAFIDSLYFFKTSSISPFKRSILRVISVTRVLPFSKQTIKILNYFHKSECHFQPFVCTYQFSRSRYKLSPLFKPDLKLLNFFSEAEIFSLSNSLSIKPWNSLYKRSFSLNGT